MSHTPSDHISVLLQEILETFRGVKLNRYIDGTLGAGGHAAAILDAHPEIESFIGLDQDPTALKIAQERLSQYNNVQLIHANFADLDSLDLGPIDGMLLDLGVSSMQLDRAERGFSFMQDGPLDMRMNPKNPLTAAEIVNTWPEAKLGKIFREYGEEKQWRGAARIIVEARKNQIFSTTQELIDLLHPRLARRAKKGIHPLTLIFQALRIAVNEELDVIRTVLPKAIEMLKPGGRLAVITFHSLEDRIVKNVFRDAASDKVDTSGIGGLFQDKEPLVNLVTRKPIVPTEEEIGQNPRSRSAKLRVVEKR